MFRAKTTEKYQYSEGQQRASEHECNFELLVLGLSKV